MPLLEQRTIRWAAYWSNIITALVVLVTLLMLIIQKDAWVILIVLAAVCALNIVLSICDLENQANEHRRLLGYGV